MDEYILISEDDPDDQFFIEEALQRNGYPLARHFVNNGDTLIQYLESNNRYPSVILLDMNMPKVTGLQALRYIKADKSLAAIPVFILTTSADKVLYGQLIEIGAAACMIKPNTF